LKQARYINIMLFVSRYFGSPISFIPLWFGVSTIVPMPKTAVNKYGYFFLKKDKVRMALYWIVSTPS